MDADAVMRFEIRRAKNRWVLRAEAPPTQGGRAVEVVCQEKYDAEIECFADFLRVLEEEFGPSTSRYSAKRIVIRVEPGDKHEG